MIQSITEQQIAIYKHDWPKDRAVVRRINGDQGQCWAVCDEETWNIITLSYTEAEANAIAKLFNKKGPQS